LFDLLDQEFHFQVDAAADCQNTKCGMFFSSPDIDGSGDALSADWSYSTCRTTRYFLNPPYSAGNIDRFMQKAYEESQKGAVVVCLVPCATDTKWWHNYAMKAQEIRFIKGRVQFIGYDDQGNEIKQSPQFSSCVVIFKKSPLGLIPASPPNIGKTIDQPKKVKKDVVQQTEKE
jgi:site-specific DNA-methyltransferase (adenine-specific)